MICPSSERVGRSCAPSLHVLNSVAHHFKTCLHFHTSRAVLEFNTVGEHISPLGLQSWPASPLVTGFSHMDGGVRVIIGPDLSLPRHLLLRSSTRNDQRC